MPQNPEYDKLLEQVAELSKENERLKEEAAQFKPQMDYANNIIREQAKRIEELESENGSFVGLISTLEDQIKKLEGLFNTERHLVNIHKKKYECLEELMMEYVNSTGATETNLKSRIKAALNL